MKLLKDKILYEYKNKNYVYYNTEIAHNNLKATAELLKNTLSKKQLKLFDEFQKMLKLYKNELTIEIVSLIFDWIDNKLEIK